MPAHQKIDGGPSVLYDAVVVMASDEGAALLAGDAAAKDFVTDAHAHCKFVGYTTGSKALFEAAALTPLMDDGYVPISTRASVEAFIETCRQVRYWARHNP